MTTWSFRQMTLEKFIGSSVRSCTPSVLIWCTTLQRGSWFIDISRHSFYGFSATLFCNYTFRRYFYVTTFHRQCRSDHPIPVVQRRYARRRNSVLHMAALYIVQRENQARNLLQTHRTLFVAVVTELCWLHADCAAGEFISKLGILSIKLVIWPHDRVGTQSWARDERRTQRRGNHIWIKGSNQKRARLCRQGKEKLEMRRQKDSNRSMSGQNLPSKTPRWREYQR